MAERYGGKYSPGGETPNAKPDPRNAYRGAVRTRAGGRVNLLFVAPLPLAVVAFFQTPFGMALDFAALGLLLLAAWLTREGLRAEEAYHARKIARRPAIPRKLFGSVVTGVGLAVAGWDGGTAIFGPLIYGGLGFALHLFAFGMDPMRDKGAEGIDQFQSDRVARAVDGAEKHLAGMRDAILRAGDRGLERRVEAFQVTARDMFRTIEDDPRDLTGARKYLGVYLMGARDATVAFADIYGRTGDASAKADYLALLDDLEQNFAARTREMLNDNRTDLDVEIDVLRARLAREGVNAE